jgi:NAD(P)-dependent dehydrogenase (short-subunit alcohol dehydrogenase family)
MFPKNILIAGASRGIGRATALALAAPGRRLLLAARSAPQLESLAQELRAQGTEAIPQACNLSAEPHVRGLLETAAAQGGIDMLVHSVGGAIVAPLEELGLAQWEETMRTHLTSAFLLCKHSLPLMREGGLIVLVSSVAARQTFPNWAAYATAKAGLTAFAGVLREELRERGIRVTVVFPAATDTQLWDEIPGEWSRRNMMQPAEVGQAIAQLAAHPTTVTVEELSIGHVVGRL